MEPENLTLLTDLYQLTMMGGYFSEGCYRRGAAFEYFFRRLPGKSGFAVLAGIEDMVERLESLRFDRESLDYLSSLKIFDEDFLKALRSFQFTCDVDAAPEGTVVFPYEPLVRVKGELWQAQLMETTLLNSLNYPTLVATKAARIRQAVGLDPVMEFGLRRAQGKDGALCGSRASFIGGCSSTSNVKAGKRYGIPVAGTQAHSWIMAFPDELTAFRAYVKAYPAAPTLLVDTYDSIQSGIPNAVTVFKEMRETGWSGRPAIRLDSGDLVAESLAAFKQFKENGFTDPIVVASGDLDEFTAAELKGRGAKINAWGVGTNLITSADCPALGGVYKLCAVKVKKRWQPRIKLSGGSEKTTEPGIKIPIRYRKEGFFAGDILYAPGETRPWKSAISGYERSLAKRKSSIGSELRGEGLLAPLLKNGKRTGELPSLEEIRSRAARQLASLPDSIRRLKNPRRYPVLLSEEMARRKKLLLEEVKRKRALSPC